MNTQALYKESYVNITIAQRRREDLLEEQRQRRLQYHDVQRLPLPSSTTPSPSSMLPVNRPIKKVISKPRRTLKDICGIDMKLQLSEWLVWPLNDMQLWQLVPCPCGIRCLIMAHRGRTEIYHKSGRRFCSFKSKLPGDATSQTTYTVLDCIYDMKNDTIYVLDALYFHAQELIACTAEFRYFWLQSQFHNLPDLHERNDSNEKPFHLLPRYNGDHEEDFRAALMKFPHFTNNDPELDGFLFYHKEAHYTYGSTPLVTWLYAFMVTDILGYNVNENYVKPSNYLTPMQYLAEFDGKLAKKTYKNVQNELMNNSNKMTTTTTTTTTALRKRHLSSTFDEVLDNYDNYDEDNDDNYNNYYYDNGNICDDLLLTDLDEM